MVARAADRQARQHYVESLRFDAKQSRDMRGISNPFSTVNLAAWLFPSESRNREETPNNRPSADLASPSISKSSLAAMVQRRTSQSQPPAQPFASLPPQPTFAKGEEEKKGARGSTGEAASGRGEEAAAVRDAPVVADRLRAVTSCCQNWGGPAGQVYHGEFLGARVAIKQLFSSFIDPSNLDEFSREVTLLHKLKHPHVLTFYGISRRDVYCFIVTEYCPYALDAILSEAESRMMF